MHFVLQYNFLFTWLTLPRYHRYWLRENCWKVDHICTISTAFNVSFFVRSFSRAWKLATNYLLQFFSRCFRHRIGFYSISWIKLIRTIISKSNTRIATTVFGFFNIKEDISTSSSLDSFSYQTFCKIVYEFHIQ